MANSLGHIDLTFCAGITRGRPRLASLAVTRRGVLIIASYASRNHSLLFAMPGIGPVAPWARRWGADRACGPQAPLPGRQAHRDYREIYGPDPERTVIANIQHLRREVQNPA